MIAALIRFLLDTFRRFFHFRISHSIRHTIWNAIFVLFLLLLGLAFAGVLGTMVHM
jgi:hypothetical protein